MDYRSLTQKIVNVSKDAGIGFVSLVVLTPLVLLLSSFFLGLKSPVLAIHIISGFFWFLLVIGSPLVVALIELDYIPEEYRKMFIRNIPRSTFVAFALGLTAVLSGSLLFIMPSVESTDVITWRLLALGAGWFIFFLGLLGPNRFHLGVYYEDKSENTSESLISSLNKRNMIVGAFEALLITGFVVAMNFL